MKNLLDVVSLKMVKDREIINKHDKISTPEAVYDLLKDLIQYNNKETFVVICLDNQNRPINVSIVSIGTVTSTLANAGEVYKIALTSNASSIILAHNHPSGSLKPSIRDIEVTKNIIAIGKMLEISVDDHIIITEDGFYSMEREDSYIFSCSIVEDILIGGMA